MWMMLAPREAEAVRNAVAKRDSYNGQVLTMLKERLKPGVMDAELELTDQELIDVEMASIRWQDGGERAFKAVLQAADRHAR